MPVLRVPKVPSSSGRPIKETAESFFEIQRAAEGPPVQSVAGRDKPVVLGPVRVDSVVGVLGEVGAFKIDGDAPPGVVQRVDVDAEVVFPLAVALRQVPLLQPNQRVRRGHAGHGTPAAAFASKRGFTASVRANADQR